MWDDAGGPERLCACSRVFHPRVRAVASAHLLLGGVRWGSQVQKIAPALVGPRIDRSPQVLQKCAKQVELSWPKHTYIYNLYKVRRIETRKKHVRWMPWHSTWKLCNVFKCVPLLVPKHQPKIAKASFSVGKLIPVEGVGLNEQKHLPLQQPGGSQMWILDNLLTSAGKQ